MRRKTYSIIGTVTIFILITLYPNISKGRNEYCSNNKRYHMEIRKIKVIKQGNRKAILAYGDINKEYYSFFGIISNANTDIHMDQFSYLLSGNCCRGRNGSVLFLESPYDSFITDYYSFLDTVSNPNSDLRKDSAFKAFLNILSDKDIPISCRFCNHFTPSSNTQVIYIDANNSKQQLYNPNCLCVGF